MKTKRWRASPELWVILPVAVLADRSGICAATLVAAAVHECGHLLAARLLHVPLRGFRMEAVGARLEIVGRMLSFGEEWLLSAAGPLFSLLFALVPFPAWRWEWARCLSCASLLLGILNLLPIRSFDGGRMLECLLNRLFSPRAVNRVMGGVSFLFLFFLWAIAVYFLLRAGDGLSLFFFSMTLFFRFFDGAGADVQP